MASVQLVSSNGRFLFVDGFLSDWDKANEWLDRFTSVCTAVKREDCDTFSYFELGKPYDESHTIVGLEPHIERFVDYARFAPTPFTPIAYSVGAAITILGTCRAIVSGHSIRRVVLVAPATSPSRGLYQLFQRLFGRGVSQAVEELCVENSPRRLELSQAFAEILTRGVRVEVVLPPIDKYCPFRWPMVRRSADIASLEETFLDLERINQTNAGFHESLRDHPLTLREICRLVS